MAYKYETSDRLNYPLLKDFAAYLRNHPTETESMLWSYMRAGQLGTKYRRQHIIGNYIADFACLEKKLIIEIDGLCHSHPDRQEDDATRTQWLESQGWKVIRFTNEDVWRGVERVLERIKHEQANR